MKIKLLLASINGSFHTTSPFFVLATYVEIIFMRRLHDPIVMKLCLRSRATVSLFHKFDVTDSRQ